MAVKRSYRLLLLCRRNARGLLPPTRSGSTSPCLPAMQPIGRCACKCVHAECCDSCSFLCHARHNANVGVQIVTKHSSTVYYHLSRAQRAADTWNDHLAGLQERIQLSDAQANRNMRQAELKMQAAICAGSRNVMSQA